MIGVVVVDAGEYPPVLGVPAPLRAALTMQQAGATAVCFSGEGAAAWADAFRRDDRRGVEVIDAAPLREDPRVTVDGGVVFDRATLTRAFASPCLAWIGDAVVLSHRSQGADEVALVDDGAPDLDLAPDALCLRAREPADVALVEDGLLQRLRKPQDGIVARALNRSLSLSLTRVLARTPLRPNDLSFSILFVGLAGAALASTGERLPLALGGLLFQAQSVLDGCDGELARVTFRGSKLGEWIDTVGDDITNYAFFGALGAGLWRAGLGEGALWLALAAVSLGSLCSLIEYRLPLTPSAAETS
ncbi:MAG: CDP-alcohol phosphatidyltransferase family protein [Polyangiales bacterium]